MIGGSVVRCLWGTLLCLAALMRLRDSAASLTCESVLCRNAMLDYSLFLLLFVTVITTSVVVSSLMSQIVQYNVGGSTHTLASTLRSQRLQLRYDVATIELSGRPD